MLQCSGHASAFDLEVWGIWKLSGAANQHVVALGVPQKVIPDRVSPLHPCSLVHSKSVEELW